MTISIQTTYCLNRVFLCFSRCWTIFARTNDFFSFQILLFLLLLLAFYSGSGVLLFSILLLFYVNFCDVAIGHGGGKRGCRWGYWWGALVWNGIGRLSKRWEKEGLNILALITGILSRMENGMPAFYGREIYIIKHSKHRVFSAIVFIDFV